MLFASRLGESRFECMVGDRVHLEQENALRHDEKSKKYHVHNKLVLVTEGPLMILRVDSDTATTERSDGAWERVSYDRLRSAGSSQAALHDSSRV